MENKIVRDLTRGNVAGELVTFAIPFMLANVLQIFYNIVDMIIVGQFVGSEGLSAVSIGADLMHFQLLICMGFASAGQIMISQYVGAKQTQKLRRSIGTLFTVILVLGVVMTVVGLVFLDSFLRILNTPGEAYEQARSYCAVCFGGILFSYGYNVVSSVLRGMGDSKRPLMFVAVASVINIILDLILVSLCGMGAAGAALATVIGQAVSLVVSVMYLYRRQEDFCFDFRLRSFAVDRESFHLLMRLGIPLTIQSTAISVSQLFVSSRINAYGLVVSAVSGVGQKIGQVAMVITNAINAAGSAMIGQNFAAGRKDRVKQVVWISWGISLAFCGMLAVLIVLFPEQIFGIFNSEPEILAMSHRYVLIAVLSFLGFALRNPMMALMNGLGCARLALFTGIMDGVVSRVLLAIWLGGFMGIMGYWLGGTIAGFVPFLIGGVFFFSGLWERVKPVVNTDKT